MIGSTTHRGPTWYRSDHARNKSVRRRANPWYRRLGRGAVALSVLGVVGVGLYFGARATQDYLNRDRLPAPGAEVPEIRETSFQIRSSGPAPELDGILTLDATTGAFQFVGRGGGPQSGIEVVSPDGSTMYISESSGAWRSTDSDNADAQAVRQAVGFVRNDKNADAILTNRLRRGYVELAVQTTEGEGDNELTRYEIELDTLGFSVDYPLQWREFVNDAVPGVQTRRSLPIVIWIDPDGVLVRVRVEQANWSWDRLSYSSLPFVPPNVAPTASAETTATTQPAD